MYWAKELAAQDQDADLKAKFTPLAQTLEDNEAAIVKELNEAQGKSVDIKGYYYADEKLAEQVMRPSTLFNEALASL
jgi:isocitrate dehydrogenase